MNWLPLTTALGEVTALIVAISALLTPVVAVFYGHTNKKKAEDVKEKVENGG